ncbi:phosphonate transport system permease protein [Bacillus thermophilus]|uniref:Phosphonate transport system permease protein n=1 Tax=Siminovitchia thermophila TaxID=1245522 RepID=A0ABS2R925_9BACI|nr:phosphonate ABC transporter, permease protein PhnE [Siminovitchia thermophila]MBM7716155.1 phosphonate transport system permease protein [Siminovitchia thermophila]ONK21492.1 phosphonate ABC transporter, permease protein PhnE [Bacillus sp. VT-16-64]
MTQRNNIVYIRRFFIGLVILAIYVWAFAGLPAIELKETSMEIVSAIMAGLFSPDWAYVYDPGGEDLLRGLLDTVAIAVLGTFIAGILSIPFAFMASNNITKSKTLVGTNKFILSFIRVFPDIVLALLFIKAVGPGAFAGVLALGIGAVGMLGKLISESIENVDLSAREALIATGANPVKTFMFAVVPQVLPNYFSFVMYRLEVNMRAASVLGVIGAGGIGTPLIFALSVRDWERVGIILLGIIVMVTLVDLLSGKIRGRFT